MRALYLPDLQSQDSYEMSGDPLHHLVNVARLDRGEELLLLNGKGLMIKTMTEEVSKRSITLKKISESTATRRFDYDLAVGIPKKEALELSLKQAVELGFRKIFLVRAAYSQTKLPEIERIHSLLVSALEQSNAPFLPEIAESSWVNLPWNDYGTVLILDSQLGKSPQGTKISTPALLIVGPEGGFSPEESTDFHSKNRTESLLLPTPILRTPTAVAAGAGVMLQRLMC